MSEEAANSKIQNVPNNAEKHKKVQKLYRCSECTNSVTLTVEADVICTRCNIAMRLFEAEQNNLFNNLSNDKDAQ